jgi:hypothetical protein
VVRSLRRAGPIVAAAALCAAAPACGYRLAGHNQLLPPQIKTIGILPFTNTTRRTEVDQRITEQVTQTFISRGGYRALPTAQGADAVLKGEVTGYDVNPVKVGRDGRATAYEVIITASVELKDATTEKVYFRSDHFIFKQQYEVSRSTSQFIDTEIVAIQDVAHDFAESVVTSILEGF